MARHEAFGTLRADWSLQTLRPHGTLNTCWFQLNGVSLFPHPPASVTILTFTPLLFLTQA